MSDGLTSQGFKRKRLDAILEDKNDAVRSVFGNNINLTPESPDGQINGVLAESDANLWELAEACYNAYIPSKTTGNSLSDLVTLNGIKRIEATATVVDVTFTGDSGTEIPAGTILSTSDGSSTLSTDNSVLIGLGGTADVRATLDTTGPIIIGIGTVTELENLITGVDSVTNLEAGITGQSRETDAELRIRRERSIMISSVGIVDSISASLLELAGISYVRVYENDTNSLNSMSMPAHSLLAVVEGADEEEIAEILHRKKPTGITLTGNTTVQIQDSQGIDKDIYFSRPNELEIHVRVDVTTLNDFPSNGSDLIKQAIVDYANGDLINNRSYGVGDNIVRTELYTPVNIVDGHSISLIAIKSGSSASETDISDISVSFDEVGTFSTVNIEVNLL